MKKLAILLLLSGCTQIEVEKEKPVEYYRIINIEKSGEIYTSNIYSVK